MCSGATNRSDGHFLYPSSDLTEAGDVRVATVFGFSALCKNCSFLGQLFVQQNASLTKTIPVTVLLLQLRAQ